MVLLPEYIVHQADQLFKSTLKTSFVISLPNKYTHDGNRTNGCMFLASIILMQHIQGKRPRPDLC